MAFACKGHQNWSGNDQSRNLAEWVDQHIIVKVKMGGGGMGATC